MEGRCFMSDVDTGAQEEYPATLPTSSQSQPAAPGSDCSQVSTSTSEQDDFVWVEGLAQSSQPLSEPMSHSLEDLTSEVSDLHLESSGTSSPLEPIPLPHLDLGPESEQQHQLMEPSGSASLDVVSCGPCSLEEDSAVARSRLPIELKEEFFDGVIIHHEDDLDLAGAVKGELVSLRLEGGQTAKIALENESTSGGRSELYNFEKWFDKATWVFLLITRNFCHPQSSAESFKADVSLTQSCLYPVDKRDFVVPIFTMDKKRDPSVPACLRVLAGVNCSSSGNMTDEDKRRMTKTLESKIRERQLKEDKQERKQIAYLEHYPLGK